MRHIIEDAFADGPREAPVPAERRHFHGDVPGFSSALAKISREPEFARWLGEKGKFLVQNKFNEYTVADRVEEVYNHVLKNKFTPLPSWELDAR